MLASDELGIDVDKITVKWGDTDLVPEGGGTGGSRSLQQGGAAVQQAARELLEVARQRAASELEANPADLVFDTSRSAFAVAGDPDAAVPLTTLAAAEPLLVRAVFRAPGPTFPFGAHLAVAEVDTETGKAVLRRMVTVDDAGTVINPLLAEGQRHGGIAQGAAQALFEEVRYDAEGNPLTSTFADYSFPSAAELPSFELADMATPTSYNPLGAKGIGEAGTIGATPAVQNAIVDALSHLGVRHIDMPAAPQRVWQAIRAAAGGQCGRGQCGRGRAAARAVSARPGGCCRARHPPARPARWPPAAAPGSAGCRARGGEQEPALQQAAALHQQLGLGVRGQAARFGGPDPVPGPDPAVMHQPGRAGRARPRRTASGRIAATAPG